MHIEELATDILPLSRQLIDAAQTRFDNLIKPIGSLAQLERMTDRYAAIIGSSDKKLVVIPESRLFLIWGTEAYKDRIEEIFTGKRAITALCRQVRIKPFAQFVTSTETVELIEEGAMLTGEYIGEEKGEIVCLGTFATAPAPEKWLPLLEERDGILFLEKLGVPESSAMTGAILRAAALRVPVILDGVAVCLAAAAAAKFNEAVLGYCFAGHESTEAGMTEILEHLKLEAPLKLNLPDSSGVGALTCLDIFDAGIKAYTQMETFEEAQVHIEVEEFSLKKQMDKLAAGREETAENCGCGCHDHEDCGCGDHHHDDCGCGDEDCDCEDGDEEFILREDGQYRTLEIHGGHGDHDEDGCADGACRFTPPEDK